MEDDAVVIEIVDRYARQALQFQSPGHLGAMVSI
jgi:hypothetical protein